MTMSKRLSTFQHLDKFIDVYHINEGKRCLLQDIIMMVLRDDIAGISLKGTVHKLVVIRVGCDEAKMVIHLHHPGIRKIKNRCNNIRRNLWPNLLSKYLLILSQYLVGDTQSVIPINEISPNGIIRACFNKLV